MGLLSQHLARVEEIKAREREQKWLQNVVAQRSEWMENPELSGAERMQAHEKYLKTLGIGPGEDAQQHGGLFAAIGNLVHHHTKAMDSAAAQQNLKQAQQRVAQTAPGMGAPAAGSPNPDQTTTTLNPANVPFLPPPGSGMQAPTPPPPQPPAEVSRGLQGAGEAVSGGSTGSNPVNAAAGAGVAPPAAQAAAAAPIAMPPPPGQWMSLPGRAEQLHKAGLDTTNEAARANDLAKIAQRRKLMEANPKDFEGLQPFERLQFLTGGNITRGANVGHLPPVQEPDGTFSEAITDPYSGAVIGKRSLGGVPLTAARERISGAPFLGTDGKWTVNVVDFNGKFIRQQPLGGVPQNVVVASSPTVSGGASTKQEKVGVDDEDHPVYAPIGSSHSTTTRKVIPGAGPINIPPPPGIGGPPQGPKPKGTPGDGTKVFKDVKSESGYKRDIENPLTPAAQNVVMQTTPVLSQIQRIKTELEKYKDSSAPGTTILPRIAYAMGFGNDTSGFLSELEMNRILSGARILKGASRSASVLDKAMIHTPNAWKDSGKLMYDKISRIEQNLNDIVKAAKDEGQKYPGMKKPIALTPPGGGRIKILSVEPVHQ